MGNAKHVGRVGALAIALGVGVATIVVPESGVSEPQSTGSSAVKLTADATALIVGGTTVPTWHDANVTVIMNQFITPTHPAQSITPVAVTTPQEYWPITGLFRLAGFAVGDPSIWGLGGPGWPDVPWWKLSGLFDLTINQSIQAGVVDLEQSMAEHGNDDLVIYGLSQGATVANTLKRKLAERYPVGTPAPDIDFVLQGDPNHPNGGLSSRFPGLYIPILDLTFDGPAPTDTQFDTVEVNRQYDGAADFPLYPLNVVATANALLGFVYLHTHPFDVSLPEDPTTSPAYQGTHGDTSYYFFETENLPLFAPLRSLGVPESLIDVVEPFFRVLVELGYDRSIPAWEPTPARLIPTIDPGKVTADLVHAIGEGVDNALSLVGSPPLPSIPAPVTGAAPANETNSADMSTQSTPMEAAIATREMSMDNTPLTTTATEAEPQSSTHTASDEQLMSPGDPRVATAKPTKPRSVVRDSLGVDSLPSDGPEPERNGDQPTTRATPAGAEAATGEPSSTESSSAASSSAGSPAGGGSSGSGDDGS